MKGDKDSTTSVVAGFHRRGCVICRCKLIERHRIIPGTWGGQYERGNVVRLCPTHHKLLHVLIDWQYSQSVGQWKPWPTKDGKKLSRGEQYHRLVGYVQTRQLRLWDFYMNVQRPVVTWKIAMNNGADTAGMVPDVFHLYYRWRAMCKNPTYKTIET